MAPKGRKPGGRAKSSPGEADATAAAAPAGGAEGSPIAAASVEEGSAKKRKLLQLTGADEEMEDAFQSQVLTGAADEATEGDAGEAKADELSSLLAPGHEDNREPLFTPSREEKKDKKDKKEKKEKKEKKDKGEKADKDEEEAGEESATEYPDCDLAATPERLHVRNSGHSKIDGEYRRLDKPSRGRPAYSMQREGKKPLYLFWYKSNKWLISLVLGAHKNLARVDDSGVEGRRQPPCEPYPHAWKVMAEESSKEKSKDNKEKEKRSYQVAQPMRVIDSATLDGAGEDFLGAEPDASGDSRKKARKGSKSAVDASSGASGSEATGSTAGDKAADAAKGDGKAESKAADAKGRDADAEMIANMAGGDSDSDDEDDEAAKPEGAKSDKESDSGSSDSDSDSGQSSSSAPASPQKPKAAAPAASAAPGSASPGGTAATAAAAQPKAGPAAPQAAPEEQERKRQAFVGKLRTQLENIKDPKQRHQKLQQVRAMLNERADHLQKVAGMNPSEVKALTDSLERDFGPRGGKRMPLVRGKGQPDGASGGQAAPSTPPEQRYAGDGGGAPPHRLPLAAKSAIKGKNGNRFKGKTPRITWPHTNSTHTVPVECFRGLGEQLWFHMPGAYVVCDNCEKSVPQSMGALQGEPQRPQFAQCQFLCSECMAQQMAGQQLNMGYQQ